MSMWFFFFQGPKIGAELHILQLFLQEIYLDCFSHSRNESLLGRGDPNNVKKFHCQLYILLKEEMLYVRISYSYGDYHKSHQYFWRLFKCNL